MIKNFLTAIADFFKNDWNNKQSVNINNHFSNNKIKNADNTSVLNGNNNKVNQNKIVINQNYNLTSSNYNETSSIWGELIVALIVIFLTGATFQKFIFEKPLNVLIGFAVISIIIYCAHSIRYKYNWYENYCNYKLVMLSVVTSFVLVLLSLLHIGFHSSAVETFRNMHLLDEIFTGVSTNINFSTANDFYYIFAKAILFIICCLPALYELLYALNFSKQSLSTISNKKFGKIFVVFVLLTVAAFIIIESTLIIK